MRKSVIAATAVIVIAVALVATYVWYGDDGRDDGDGASEGTGPSLSNYDNGSTFFEAYIDGRFVTASDIPIALEPQGNVIELRPTDHVTGVTDNGDGTYGFTLSTYPGETHTLVVDILNASDLESSVSDGIVTLTFDADGEVTLLVDSDVFDLIPGEDTATLTGYELEGADWSIHVNGEPIESFTMPITIPQKGAVIRIVADSDVSGVYHHDDGSQCGTYLFKSNSHRGTFYLRISLDGAEIVEQNYDQHSKVITFFVDCESSLHISVRSTLPL